MPDEAKADAKIFNRYGQIENPVVAHEVANVIDEARQKASIPEQEKYGFFDAQSKNNLDLPVIISAAKTVKLEEESKYDELTGLLKQKAYERAISDARIQVDQGLMDGFGLVRTDADHFSWVNDLGGHLFGNHLIEQMAKLLQRHLRPKDRAFRIGHGDELGLLYPDVNDPTVLSKLLTRILAEVHSSLLTDTCEAIIHSKRIITTEDGLQERDGVYTIQELYKGLGNFQMNISGNKERFRNRGKGTLDEKNAVIRLIDDIDFNKYKGLLLDDTSTLTMESKKYDDYIALMRDFTVEISRIFQQITISVGGMVVTKDTPGSAIALNRKVDKLTYQAKDGGGAQVIIAGL